MTSRIQFDQALRLAPLDSRSRIMLFAVAVLMPLFITAGAMAIIPDLGVSTSLIDGDEALTMSVGLVSVLVLTSIVWLVIDRVVQRHRVSLEHGVLVIATSFYTRRLALAELRLEDARVVDLAEHTELKPLLKTNAVSAPGFRSGTFRLRNRSKAFVAITHGRRVLWVPTTAGHGLLLEFEQPQGALVALRTATDSMRRVR